MQLQRFFPIIQIIIILFVFCKAYLTKQKIYNVIDNRVFWGLAALYNLPDVFFAVVYYVGIKTRELETTPSEDWHPVIRMIVLCFLLLMDVLAIYFLSQRELRFRLVYPWLMGGIVGVLLVVYKLWIAPYYDFYEVQIWRFIEVNIFPVIISLYLFFRKYLTTIVRNNQNG